MDDQRFDQLARMMGQGIGRRSVVAGLVAAITGTVGLGSASANGIGGRRTVCRPIGVGCTRGSQCCSGNCPTSRALPRAVRNRCGCPDNQVFCGGGCVDVTESNDNCGSCGYICATWSGEICCNGECVNTDTSEAHCGACGQTCDKFCVSGECMGCRVDVDNGYNQCIVDVNGETWQACNNGMAAEGTCTSNDECAEYSSACLNSDVLCLCVDNLSHTWTGSEVGPVVFAGGGCQGVAEKGVGACVYPPT